MKNVCLSMLALLLVTACTQKPPHPFVGRIYTGESHPNTFFQLVAKDSARYYTLYEFGKQHIEKTPATWKMENDSLMRFTILDKKTKREFMLRHFKEGDFLVDEYHQVAFRREKQIRYEQLGFELKE